MKSVLIIVTSANIKSDFGNKAYNEQEVGLAKALSRKGCRCGIAYYGGNQEREEDFLAEGFKIRMYLFKGRDFLKTAFFENYDRIFKQYDILLPITYDHYESYRLAMKYPAKTIVYNGTYFSVFNKRYNLKCAVCDKFFLPGYKKKNTMFITKNRLSAEFLNKKGLANTHVVGVGFDAAQMSSSEMLDSELSKKIEKLKSDGQKILLYVGRLEKRRNILFLLELFKAVSKKTKSTLVIIGNGTEKYKSSCKDFISSNGLGGSILYQEKMEQRFLPKIYKESDLFLLPTSYEIFGMVILEAMYFGTPVLTTLNGGSDILIKNEESGFIISDLDLEKWEEKCIDVLQRDNSRLLKKAHNIVAENFVWDVLADKFLDCFDTKIRTDYFEFCP